MLANSRGIPVWKSSSPCQVLVRGNAAVEVFLKLSLAVGMTCSPFSS